MRYLKRNLFSCRKGEKKIKVYEVFIFYRNEYFLLEIAPQITVINNGKKQPQLDSQYLPVYRSIFAKYEPEEGLLRQKLQIALIKLKKEICHNTQ